MWASDNFMNALLEKIGYDLDARIHDPVGLLTADRNAEYEDLCWMNPTGGLLHVYLPTDGANHIGEKVTVKNYSASLNGIEVHGQGGDTIDGVAPKTMTLAWELACFVRVTATQWICHQGDS
jgi:hypothetical protein